jgi:hypothetical protein
MEIDENDLESGVYAISLVADPAIMSNFIYLSKQYKIELKSLDAEKRLLIGPALIPDLEIPRLDDDGSEYYITFSKETIEKVAQLYMQRQHNNSATLEHEFSIEDLSVVESWLVENPNADKSNAYNMSYPSGTWMVAMKVNNDTIWNDYVKTGKVGGYSIEGLFSHNLVEASKQQHLVALSELIDIFDNEYAEELLATMKGIIKKDARMKDGKYLELETYSDYPDAVKNNAQKGIDLNEKVNNRCATSTGKIRAQQLANGRNISVQTIKRMYAYLSRAEAFYDEKDMQACGTISFLLWGGLSGKAWSASKLKELGLFNEELETAVSVSSSYTGQFGNGKTKSKKPKKDNYIAPAMLEDEVNMDVFGYKTKYFQICPGAQATFKSLVMLPNLEEDNIGMIRSAAVIADAVFKIENDVLESKTATQSQLDEATVLVDDYKDIIEEIDEDNNTSTDVSYMDGHIETIKSYVK